MTSEIKYLDESCAIIGWTKIGIGFGELRITRSSDTEYMVDTEFMDLRHIIEVIKNCDTGGLTGSPAQERDNT